MSDKTTNLQVSYILAAQAQKHVTHNEALRLLDRLVQLSVLDRDLTVPPGSPADGDRHIGASGGTGGWTGWDLIVVLLTDGTWQHLPPRAGLRAWVQNEGLLLVYDGAGWIGTTPADLHKLGLLGLGTTADAANPFFARLNAALWIARTVAEGETCVLFYTMNKEAAGDDLGLTPTERFRDKGARRSLWLRQFPPRGFGRRQHLLRRPDRGQRHRHRRAAANAALQGLHEL